MVVTEQTVNNITEYVNFISILNEDNQRRMSFIPYELLFRGQSDVSFDLIPSLGRGRDFCCDCTIFNEERNMIDMAKFKMPQVFRNDLSPIELLALLQHYGVPTRLLDVTENALVALYFACSKDFDKDGEVIVFCHNCQDISNFPVVNAIADSYRFSNGTETPLSIFYKDVMEQPYFLEQKSMLSTIHKDDESGGEWIAECCKSIFYIYAPIQTQRQQAQQGRYILFPNKIGPNAFGEKSFLWLIDPIPKNHPDIVARFIVPKDAKKTIISNLSVFGISEATLFCDSIDIVCKGIVEQFKARNSK